MAGAATTVYVVAEGIGAWPALAFDMTPETLRGNLDAGVAQALDLSRDGLHAAAAVLLGASILTIAWLLARSNLWGHRPLAAFTAVVGASAAASMVLGPEFIGAGALIPWGIVIAVVLLVARSRLGSAPPTSDGDTPATQEP